MRLIAITLPQIWPDEGSHIADTLINGGVERVHLRHPQADADSLRRLLDTIPAELYPRLSVHDCHEVTLERGLGGIHLNGRHPQAPAQWQGMLSRSCHSLEEVEACEDFDYLTLSPVFNSISKPGYLSAFSLEKLRAEAVSLLSQRKVFALGGVTPELLPSIAEAGFTGAAMMGAHWKKYLDKSCFNS